jgi:hypothetical protein
MLRQGFLIRRHAGHTLLFEWLGFLLQLNSVVTIPGIIQKHVEGGGVGEVEGENRGVGGRDPGL